MSIDFRKTKFMMVAAKVKDCPQTELPEVVLAGRSNVGKSSFINVLGDNKGLAKISSTPGKTRLVIYFETDNSILFTDLPGYGYAKVSNDNRKNFQNLVDNYFTSGRKFSLIIHFLDIRHTPSEEDKLMKWWMDENNSDYILVLTKADKISKQKINSRINEIRRDLNVAEDIPIMPFSAIKKTGIEEIRQEIAKRIQME